jgi:hypothetical protein
VRLINLEQAVALHIQSDFVDECDCTADEVDLAHPHSQIPRLCSQVRVGIVSNQTLPLPQLDAHRPGSHAQLFQGCKSSRGIVTGGKEADAPDVSIWPNEVTAIFQVR